MEAADYGAEDEARLWYYISQLKVRNGVESALILEQRLKRGCGILPYLTAKGKKLSWRMQILMESSLRAMRLWL
jgi:hypothetical protein